MSSVCSGLGRLAVTWCIRVKNPDVKECTLMPLPPKTLRTYIERAPSSELAVLSCRLSPVNGCSSGSTATLWQTSGRHLAVMSLKRGAYNRYSPWDRAATGRYASQHGVAAAAWDFSRQLKRIVRETTVRSIKAAYVREVQRKRSGGTGGDVTVLPLQIEAR